MNKIDFIFSEFNSKNHVDWKMIKNFFPEAELRLYNEQTTKPVFDIKHPRYGWRMHDYQQLMGLLESKADIAIAMDADMKIVNHSVNALIPLTRKFGLCLPCNPRMTVLKDTLIGTDSDKMLDASLGLGYAFNSAIIALDKSNDKAIEVIYTALSLMKEKPMRLPLILWRAVYKVGFYPCILPPQWCVCDTQEGCGDEIILHIGHIGVRKFYGIA